MSDLSLHENELIPDGIRRLASERLDEALSSLQPARGALTDEAIHEARKRLKEARALLRLIRDEFPADDFAAENAIFRDAARPLSQVRDAQVMIEAVGGLHEHIPGDAPAGVFAPLKKALTARRREIRRQILRDPAIVGGIVQELTSAQERVPHWPIDHAGWKAVGSNLERIYRQGRKAMSRAMDDPTTDDHWHEWRKRAKDLRYGLEVLHPAWPGMMKALAKAAEELGDLLGEDHDLAVLTELSVDELKDALDKSGRQVLRTTINARRKSLKAEACALGIRLYLDDPDTFCEQIRCYWKAGAR